MPRPLLLTAAIVGAAGTAHAEPIAAHALVVGSNAAGPGQTELRYAEEDARRVGALLTELGGYTPASVDIVTRPTPEILRDRLAKLSARVAADVAAGKQARVFFYYSGHARATAIDLGPKELPLAELRQKLFAVGATLTVVVLDACQSGAFSRVKGASPTADFSFNSRAQLDATGVAVLASSTGSELSQESEALKSSYFTHHLLVGMRGAGDANNDGQVTVDEAYRYAYHQTLQATAVTAVGGQHVTLEVDLKGHGEVALSYPKAATAAIELPAQLEGKAMVVHKRAKAVVAETQKAKGKAVRIAVAPGEYEVTVRQGDRISRCPLTAPGALDLARCTNERFVDAAVKGATPRSLGSWSLDAAFMFGNTTGSDGFEQRLEDFGYREQFGPPRGLLGLTFKKPFAPLRERITAYWSASANLLAGQLWQRDTERMPLRFESNTTLLGPGIGVLLRAAPRVALYADATVGLGIGRSRFVDQDDVATNETHYGWGVLASAGASYERLFGTPISFDLGMKVGYAPVIDNDIGDTMNAGGVFFGIGLGYVHGGSR